MRDNSVGTRILRILLGIIFFIAAFFCFTRPMESLMNLTFFFGVVAIVKGISYILMYFNIKRTLGVREGMPILLGILDIIIGILFIRNVFAGSIALGYMFAIWFLLDTIAEFAYASNIKIYNKGLYFLSILFCIIGIMIAIMMFVRPQIAMLSISFLAGFYFLSFGILEISLAIKER